MGLGAARHHLGLALLGVVAECTVGFRFPRLATLLYVGIAWLVLVAIRPLVTRVAPAALAWLAAGGICYASGIAFFATDTRLRYGHAVRRPFVLAGSVCHFWAVLRHAAAPSARRSGDGSAEREARRGDLTPDARKHGLRRPVARSAPIAHPSHPELPSVHELAVHDSRDWRVWMLARLARPEDVQHRPAVRL